MVSKPLLLGIFAHPDDETFRPGGALALLSQAGVEVQIITATNGEGGSCGNPPLCTPAELPEVRINELRCACRVLGIKPPHCLGLPEGHLQEIAPLHLEKQIVQLTKEISPQVVISFGPDGLSGHADHIALGNAAYQAYSKIPEIAALYTLAVPQSVAEKLKMRQVSPVPDEKIAIAVNVSSVWDIKRRAMRCHATQWESTPVLRANEEIQKMFFRCEYFVKAAERQGEKNFFPEALEKYGL